MVSPVRVRFSPFTSAPRITEREDSVVDPYPHQGHDAGQITRVKAKVVAVGVKTTGFGFRVGVKTGNLSGHHTLTPLSPGTRESTASA